MSLGKQLAATLQKEKDAEIEKQRAEEQAKKNERALIRKCRIAVFEQFKKVIEEKIPAGKKPTKKITTYAVRQWIMGWNDEVLFGHGITEDADVIADFNAWLAQNDLTLVIHQEHDGMGMEEWITLSVAPKL